MENKILVIDNYDSFTYNLVQYIGTITKNITVFRNDEITLEEIKKIDPTHIVVSPGPGFPISAGISVDVIKNFGRTIPIIGVCLGHQAVGEAFGGKIVHAARLLHGKSSRINLSNSPLFKGLPKSINAARYHSLIIEKETLPDCLQITAITDENEIMGVQHKEYPVFGVQFHPESIISENGMDIISNFCGL